MPPPAAVSPFFPSHSGFAAHSDARGAAAASSAEGGVAAVDSEAGLDEWIRSNMADATLRRHRASLLQVTEKLFIYLFAKPGSGAA